MKFQQPLIRGKLIRRYKRFLADVLLSSNEIVTAHCANPGAMLGLTEEGAEVWLSPAQNPSRKLRWTWEMIRVGNSMVGINTFHPNTLVHEALTKKRIPELSGYTDMRREVKYGKSSRIDILLEDAARGTCFCRNKKCSSETGVRSRISRLRYFSWNKTSSGAFRHGFPRQSSRHGVPGPKRGLFRLSDRSRY